MIKLGLAGTWHVHFDGYVKEFLNTSRCELVCVWDRELEKAKAAGERLGIAYTDNFDDFLKEDINSVCVCCETSLHPEILMKSAKAKKHIFTEKVLCEKPEDAAKIKKAVEKNGIRFCISFPWRARADFLWIKNAVDSGLIGDISYVRMRNAHNGVSGGWLPDTFFDKSFTCGGAMMDLGAHSMYILNWLLGEPEAAVSVFTNFICKKVEDNCVTTLKYKNGAIGVSETAFVAENDPFSLQLTGTKGTILAGWNQEKLCFNTSRGWEYPACEQKADSPVESFVNGVLDNKPIPYNIDDAAELTKTMAMAYNNII